MKAKRAKTQEQEQTNSQVMTRDLSKDKSTCRVTFSLPKEAAPEAQSVAVSREF